MNSYIPDSKLVRLGSAAAADPELSWLFFFCFFCLFVWVFLFVWSAVTGRCFRRRASRARSRLTTSGNLGQVWHTSAPRGAARSGACRWQSHAPKPSPQSHTVTAPTAAPETRLCTGCGSVLDTSRCRAQETTSPHHQPPPPPTPQKTTVFRLNSSGQSQILPSVLQSRSNRIILIKISN